MLTWERDGIPAAMFISGDTAGSDSTLFIARSTVTDVCAKVFLRNSSPVSSSKMAMGSKIELGRVMRLFLFSHIFMGN